MNHAELRLIVDELRDLVGRPLSGVWQPRRDRVVFGIGEERLLVVPRGPHARVHLDPTRPRTSGHPFSFQGACRAHLVGRLREITLDPDDRVIDLRFDGAALHLRLTGVRGGLWLVRDGRVLAAYDGPAPPALPELAPPPPTPVQARAPRFAVPHGTSANAAAAAWFGARESDARLRERRIDVERRLRTRLARDRRLLEALEGDLEKADGAAAARSRADALSIVLHRVRRGQTAVDAPDPSGDGTSFIIPLDPVKSPGDNLAALYRRARRLERMGERVIEQIEAVEARVRTLGAALAVVSDAPPALLDDLEALAPAPRAAREAAASAPWVTWRSDRGEEILVGRNATANRRLTFQKARGSDWWMHLRDRPGAHLVIRCERGHSPSLETLVAAAQIAGHHGRIPAGEAFEVQYTRASSVRSIPGAADGRVLVHGERVLRLERDEGPPSGWRRDDDDPAAGRP